MASAVNRRTPEGRPDMFISGIPPVSSGDPQVSLGQASALTEQLGLLRVPAPGVRHPESGSPAWAGASPDLPEGIPWAA